MALPRDNIIRLVALVILCGMVYYFSFEQGRSDVIDKLGAMERTLQAKDQQYQRCSAEVHRLKQELAKAGVTPGIATPVEDSEPNRVAVRLKESRVLFDARLVLTCLDINRSENTAKIQVNIVQEGRILTEIVGLGHAFRFNMGEQEAILILEKVHVSFITTQVILM